MTPLSKKWPIIMFVGALVVSSVPHVAHADGTEDAEETGDTESTEEGGDPPATPDGDYDEVAVVYVRGGCERGCQQALATLSAWGYHPSWLATDDDPPAEHELNERADAVSHQGAIPATAVFIQTASGDRRLVRPEVLTRTLSVLHPDE